MPKYNKPDFKEYGEDLFDNKSNCNTSTNTNKFNSNANSNKSIIENFYIYFGILVTIAIVCVVIYFIANGFSFTNHKNGICDYCSKQAEHHLGDEEFCNDHYIDRMGDIIEWSSEKKLKN